MNNSSTNHINDLSNQTTNNDLSNSITTTNEITTIDVNAETLTNDDLSDLTTTTTKEDTTMDNNAETLMNNESSNLILGDNKPIIAENLDSGSVSSSLIEDIKVIRDIFGDKARFTPVKDKKAPYEKEWQNNPKTIDYCLSFWETNPECKGFGLITGNGYLAIDFDGNNAWELIKEIGLEELAQVETTAWSSSKEGRQQKLFKIPELRLNDFSGITRKEIKSYKNISEVEKEQLEIRYERMQSVLPPQSILKQVSIIG